MAYSHALTKKGIKRRDPRMVKKGAEDAQVSGADMSITIKQAIGSMATQG